MKQQTPPRGSGDWANQKPSPKGHSKASDAHNAEMDRLKRDPQYIQRKMDRQK